jgi:hypothetical protein
MMMERGSILWLVLLGVSIIAAPAKAEIIFNDGGIHYIDYPINDHVKVVGNQTEVYWLEGASVLSLEAYDYGKVVLDGGEVQYDLESYNHGEIAVISGSVGDDFGAQLNSGPAVLMGGFISTNGDGNRGDGIWALDNGIVTIVGHDFAVDSIPVGYIELTNVLGGSAYDEPLRWLTGTLDNGDSLANYFHISPDAKIVLTPEPTTLILFALGGLMVRRKR